MHIKSIHDVLIKSQPIAIVSSALLALLIGLLDHSTGKEWQITSLYLLPLGIASWYAGRKWAIILSSFVTSIWFAAAEFTSGFTHSHPVIPFWNALMFLVIFIIFTLVLSQLREITLSLRHHVESRTAQLGEEMAKRFQAERLAIVGSMAAQMAHEVRNPLCVISLNIELLSHELESMAAESLTKMAEAKLLIDQIHTQFQHINQVVNDYMGFARIPKVITSIHSLHSYLDEKLSTMTRELEAAGVKLVKNYDPTIFNVKIDPSRIWQVILNLIRNAREAMPQGGNLVICTSREERNIVIAVSDSGCGISPSDMAMLFSPFFTTKSDGMGLGLALSQQIVTDHGGNLVCQSTQGVGTTFTISIPSSLNH